MTFQKTVRQFSFFAFLGLMTFVLNSCGASAEGETDKWNSNIQMLDRLITENAGFSVPLASVKKMASQSWDAAQEVADEDKKIEAMQSANAMVDNSFAGKLGSMPGMITEISSIRKKLSGKTMSQTLITKLQSAANKADRAVAQSTIAMNESAEDLASAESIVGPAYASLKASRDNFKSLKSDFDKETKKKKKKKK